MNTSPFQAALAGLALLISVIPSAQATPQQSALLAQARKHQAQQTAQNNAKKAAQLLLLQQRRHKPAPEPRDNVIKEAPEQPPTIVPANPLPLAPDAP